MFEWLKNLFTGEPAFVGVDLNGELKAGEQYRLVLRPKVDGTESLLAKGLLGRTFDVSNGVKVQCVRADAYRDNGGGYVVAVVEPLPVTGTTTQANTFTISVGAIIAAVTALGFLFSVERIEKAVDGTTQNVARVLFLIIVLLLVWRFLIRR